MRMPIKLIPQAIIDQYDLTPKVYNGYVYMEIMRGMYGLPQAGILANKLLKKKSKPHRYYKVDHTPGLYKHIWRPIAFTLVVDDFGVKYVGKEHAEHLFGVLKNEYTKIEVDWTGSLYCGITLKWNYPEKYMWTVKCQDMSRKDLSNLDTSHHNNRSIVHTRLTQSNMEGRAKKQHQKMIARH